VSEDGDPDGGQSHKSTLRRGFDLCLVAPVGVAVSVVEELPELLAEGRRRLEQQLGNALFVGRFVVNQKQRELSARLDGLLGNGAPKADTGNDHDAEPPPASPGPERPAPDPAAAAIVGAALADYDTLSASQVVRRLESLGPEELEAVRRYEASTRNRRTILNRAGQLLDEQSSGPSAG
jgi:hypothetical protein